MIIDVVLLVYFRFLDNGNGKEFSGEIFCMCLENIYIFSIEFLSNGPALSCLTQPNYFVGNGRQDKVVNIDEQLLWLCGDCL